MKITDVTVQVFAYRSNVVRDSEGHGHPGPEHDAQQSLITITTDEGVSGHAFGSILESALHNQVKPILVGQDPFYRERLWQALKERQRLNLATLHDKALNIIDLALWDLAGRALDQPVHRLLGAARDKAPAYASTMCGDDLPGGLDTPEAYANFALWCRERGYPAFKLHTWQPPIPGAPNAKRDIAACAAVGITRGPGRAAFRCLSSHALREATNRATSRAGARRGARTTTSPSGRISSDSVRLRLRISRYSTPGPSPLPAASVIPAAEQLPHLLQRLSREAPGSLQPHLGVQRPAAELQAARLHAHGRAPGLVAA